MLMKTVLVDKDVGDSIWIYFLFNTHKNTTLNKQKWYL